MDDRDDIYEKIIEEYKKTGSVKQVVENLDTNTIKVRRVLITEGLWESESSKSVGALFAEGKSVKEIAKILCMSEKNVQSYMPYTRGAYGGNRTDDAERSIEYRERQKKAAENQVGRQMINSSEEDIGIFADKTSDKIILFPNKNVASKDSEKTNPLPSVLKLRFELVSPYYTRKGTLDMEPEEREEFLKNAKAKEGIIREVLVHGEMNLHALHYMIQKLFGWQNSHLHHFSLSDEDFDMVTDKQNVERYLNLCGTIFQYPEAEMNDRFWDDDYEEGISFKSWLKSKYNWGYEDYAVENSYYRNREFADNLRKEIKSTFRNSSKITLSKLQEKIIYENSFNIVIEGISVRNLFRNSIIAGQQLRKEEWRGFQDLMIQGVAAEYDRKREEEKKEYDKVMSMMQDLINLRSNVIKIEQAIRYGRADEIKKYYGEDPQRVIEAQQSLISSYEYRLSSYLFQGNPRVIPFVNELYYTYDYGDDWCVKITCEEAYTANENYDISYVLTHMSEDGTILDDRTINESELEYRDLGGNIVDDELRTLLQRVYLKKQPVCVMADGLNVMDDVGGIYGYQDFLRIINSKSIDDVEEKESSRVWAKGMGWTGRMGKPQNIL